MAERPFSPRLPYDPVPAGLRLRVRVTPKASRPGPTSLLPGPDGVALKVSVSVPAQEGKANGALIKVLAKGLGVAKGVVTISSGLKSRDKVVTVAGPTADLARRMDAWLAVKGIE